MFDMLHRREFCRRLIQAVAAAALVPSLGSIAHGQGRGGGKGGNNGKGGGNSSSGNGKGGGKGAGGGKNATEKNSTPGAGVGLSSRSLSVVHSNGMQEMIRNGRYEMRDAQGRRIVNRQATGADYARLKSSP